jgi:pseudomonalisin
MPAGLRRPWLLLAAMGVVALFGAAGEARATGSTTTLQNDVVRNLGLATQTGVLPSSQPLTIGVFLKNPNQAAEDAYAKQLYDPASPSYGSFLDPDQFQQQFGVPAATTDAANAWLSGAGLKVSRPEGAGNYLLATGTVGQVQSLLGVKLNTYSWNGRSIYGNATAPVVPTSLGVGHILGLNDVKVLHTPHVAATGTPKTTVAGVPTNGAVPKTGLLSPPDLWSIYDLPASNRGSGQSMAIFGWGVTDPVVADLRSFEAEWGLPGVPVTIKYYGDASTPDTNDGGTIEWEMDTQASTGMAPDVTSETLYFAHHNDEAESLAAFAAWVNDKKGALQGSASFGECENVGNGGALLTDGMEVPGDKILEQGAIEGRTLFASTGDTGSSCPLAPVSTNGLATQLYPGLEWPSVSPWVVAVGGTVLHGDGNTPEKRLDETAWAYTGGGNSTSEPAGSYQAGVASTNCAFDADGNPYVPVVGAAGPVCRSTPDVAAISGEVATGNGMSITDDSGADQQGAGTSLSSPLWLGFWARIQAAAKSPKGLGFANYSLYKVAKSSAGRDFYDVTVGDNQPYPAKPGYDNTTGWGTPEVTQLMLDLTGRLTPSHAVTPAPVVATSATTCSPLFSDAAGDDVYAVEGQTLAAQGTSPQLDILGAQLLLSPDGQTLRSIITVRDLSTTVPTGGVENDYNLTWTFNGTSYFTQLAVEPGGLVNAYDGQLIKVSLENRYQQLHVDTGTITAGPNGTVEVDVPVANVPGIGTGVRFTSPAGAAYVREGLLAGTLEPIDSGGPTNDYVAGGC